MTFYYNWKSLSKLPIIGDKQFLDCDRVIVLMTKHPAFEKKFRCSDKLLKSMKASKLHNQYRGLHAACDSVSKDPKNTPNYNVIFIDHLIHGDKQLLGIILHEVSHLVDHLLECSAVEHVDGEIRAYLLEYYAKTIYMMMSFGFDAVTAKPDKPMKGGKE